MLEKFAHPHAHRLQGVEKEPFGGSDLRRFSKMYLQSSAQVVLLTRTVSKRVHLWQQNKNYYLCMKRRRRVGEFPQRRKFDAVDIY
jgi:hypothetical protein